MPAAPDLVRRALDELARHEDHFPPIRDGVTVDVAPTGAGSYVVAHGLHRVPRGYLLTWWSDTAARAYPSVSAYDTLTITLEFAAAGTGRVLVW